MTGILDTHVFIWFDHEPSKLSSAARAFIADPSNEILLSVVSVWEIVIKHRLGKLPLARPLIDIVDDQLANNLALLRVDLDHVLRVASLPDAHRDPFDRLLAAQSIAENAVLLTADAIFAQYPVAVVW